MVLGVCVMLVGPVWTRALAAVSVDVILSPEELQDPQLVEDTHRTQNQKLGSTALLFPYYVLGGVLIATGAVGYVTLRDENKNTPADVPTR